MLISGISKTERQKDRKTERQKDRKTERQKDRKTERQKDRKTEGQNDKKQKDRKTLLLFSGVCVRPSHHGWNTYLHNFEESNYEALC
jgi:hypothetical protein